MIRIPQPITFAVLTAIVLAGCSPSAEDVADGDDPLAALAVGVPSVRYDGRYWLLKRDEDRAVFDEAAIYCRAEHDAERLADHPNCGPVLAAARYAESRERPRLRGLGFTGILSEDAARDTAESR